jgi:hypothetical protein
MGGQGNTEETQQHFVGDAMLNAEARLTKADEGAYPFHAFVEIDVEGSSPQLMTPLEIDETVAYMISEIKKAGRSAKGKLADWQRRERERLGIDPPGA